MTPPGRGHSSPGRSPWQKWRKWTWTWDMKIVRIKNRRNSFWGPDNVLSKHAVDHDHHGSNQFETPVQKNVDLQDEKKIKRQQSWCEWWHNRRRQWCCWRWQLFIPAEEEEVWSRANHDRDGKTVLRTRDAQEAERNCHLKYIWTNDFQHACWV